MHAKTIPAIAPEFNDDVETVLLLCDKEASEDVGGEKVDEDRDTDEVRDVKEVEVGAGVKEGVVCEELIVLVIKVVVVFNEMLVRLLDWEVVECEGLDVETSNRISMTVTVVGAGSPVVIPLFLSSRSQATMCDKLPLPRSTEMQ